MKKFLLCVLLLIGMAGCSDAEKASWSTDQPAKVILYSGGKKIEEWVSTGKVVSEMRSDGCFFKDSLTGKLVHVSGTVVVKY